MCLHKKYICLLHSNGKFPGSCLYAIQEDSADKVHLNSEQLLVEPAVAGAEDAHAQEVDRCEEGDLRTRCGRSARPTRSALLEGAGAP